MPPELLPAYDSPAAIASKTTAIYDAILQSSPNLRTGNFTALSTSDLAHLFNLYDATFFRNTLNQMITPAGMQTLAFRLSSTMTKSGGKTGFRKLLLPDGSYREHYEIVIASRLLSMNFYPGQQRVSVCGLDCSDRLQALQRIFEHEIIHLYEFLTSGRSSCAAPAFKTLAGSTFGHTQASHRLISTPEIAAVQYAIRVGSMVEFDFQGVSLRGQVNRIHHRATVLVSADDGMLFSDGRRYRKYYIPLPMLRPAGPEEALPPPNAGSSTSAPVH